MKKTYLILGLVILGILIGTSIFIYQWNRKETTADTPPAHTLTTAAFLSEFKTDSAALHKKYSGTVIQLSGNVDEVESSNEAVNVLFKGEGVDLSTSFMKAENKNLAVVAGKEIAFKGKYSGYIVDDIFGPRVELANCVLVK